jgi:hypothetical protein
MSKIQNRKSELVPLDEGDDEIIQIGVYVPKWLHKSLKRMSAIKERTASSIVREALEKELRLLESQPQIPAVMPPLKFGVKKDGLEKIETVISDADLVKVLDHCTSFFGGFEIDGEGGFVNVFRSFDWKLRSLNSDQWAVVLGKIQIGFNGYEDKPSEEDWLAKFTELEPRADQVKDLMYEE